MIPEVITEALSELQLTDKTIVFPNKFLLNELDSDTFSGYFEAVTAKLKRAKKDAYFYDELVLRHLTEQGMQGLLTYLAKKPAIFFKTLTLDLSGFSSVNDVWLSNFYEVLLSLSSTNIQQLQFKSAEWLTQSQVEALAAFIEQQNAIAFDICLPSPYQEKLIQQKLDRITHLRATQRTQVSPEENPSTPVTDRPLRKRTGHYANTIDVEIQETLQQETSQETNVEFANMLSNQDQPDAYTIDTFTTAWQAGQFSEFAHSHYLDSSRNHAHQLWCNWVGAFNRRGALLSNIKLTHRACEILLRHAKHFQFGIDFQALPVGFLVEEQGEETILDFDQRLERVLNRKPLAVTLIDTPAPIPLPHDKIDKLSLSPPLNHVWKKLNSEPYDRIANRLFRQHVSELQNLTPEKLDNLFNVCTSETNWFDTKRFQFLMETAKAITSSTTPPKPQDTNFQAQIARLFPQEALPSVQDFILNYPPTMRPKHIMGEERAQAIINTFPPTQKVWWDALYAQHYAANDTIDMASLAKDFVYFKAALDALFSDEVLLPANCQFKNIDNLPTTLSRMLTILRHVDGQNHHEQLALIAELDLSSTGVIKVAKKLQGQSWAFFTPEMKLTLEEDAYCDSLVTDYITPNYRLNFNSIPDYPFTGNSQYLSWGLNISLQDNNSEFDRVKPYLQPGFVIYDQSGSNQRCIIETCFSEDFIGRSLSKSTTGSITHHVQGLNEDIADLHALEKQEETILGESWEDYKDRIKLLLKNKSSGFITQQTFKKLHLEKIRPYSKGGYRSLTINIFFLNQLPETVDPNFERALIYVRPHLYRIHEGQFEEVLLYSSIKLEKLILKELKIAKKAYQATYSDATAEELGKFSFDFEHIETNVIKYWPVRRDDFIYLQIEPALQKLTINLEKTIKDFFRFAAFQNQNNPIPLSLYSYIHQKLKEQEMPKALKQSLYTILAGSLANSPQDLKNLEKCQQLIDKIIAFKPSTTTKIAVNSHENILNEFIDASRENTPPLSCLHLLFTWFAKAGITYAFLLQELVHTYSMYKGMSDYLEEDYKAAENTSDINSHLVMRHMNTAMAFTNLFTVLNSTSSDNYELCKKLQALISTFHLSLPLKLKNRYGFLKGFDHDYALNSSLGKLLKQFNEEAKQDRLSEVLTLLSQINVNNSGLKEPLTQANFEELLTTVLTTDQPIQTFLENYKPNNHHKLLAYFPFQKISPVLADYQMTPKVRTTIANFFPERELQRQLEDFLIQFRDSYYYKDCIDQIIAICKQLNAAEHKIFVQRLIAAKGLYTPLTSLNPAHSEFMKLLKTVDEKGAHHKFLSMLELAHQAEAIETPDLATRMLRYFEKINPVTDKFLLCSINKVELTQRITSTLLKTPLDELQREGCSLLFLEQEPNANNLASLLLPHHAAYLYSNNKLFYVNQATNECINIPLNDGKHQLFLNRYTLPLDSKTLKDDELEFLSHYHRHIDDYSRRVNTLYATMDNLIKKNLGVKPSFLALFDTYHHAIATPLMVTLQAFVDALDHHFSTLNDNKLVISLCLKFQASPETLLACLTQIPAGKERLFTQTLMSEQPIDINAFNTLCERAQTNHVLMESLESPLYRRPPYPSIKTILEWETTASKSPAAYAETLKALYQAYEKAPFPRSEDNGFKEAKAHIQLKRIKENNHPFDSTGFNPQEYAALTQSLREKATDGLLAWFKTFSEAENPSLATLIAASAELLYRSTGKELNTTQYLSSLILLNTPGHVTSQIDTSEGKSRIMMLTCICQAALGKTVDFVTADIHLAAREFVEYQTAFNLLNIPTQLIFADTPSHAYQKQGINFSDATNLILFRNRAHSLQQGQNVLDSVPEKRCLQLDEADKTYFDSYSSRNNFSSTSDALLRDMPWVYTLLIAYFMQNQAAYDPWDLFKNDIDGCRETFLQFAKNHTICLEDDSRIRRLEALSYDKIEEWQTMAFIAMQQRYRQNFDIKSNQLIQTPHGLKMASNTVLVIDNDWAPHSKLSFGADQCHNAYLDYLWKNPDKNSDPELKEALATCNYGFHVPDEKQIVYSSTSKNFLDDYQDGEIKAVTGTAGSLIERHEARCLYQSANKRPMAFIDMPREKGFHRRDKALYLATEAKSQLNAIVDEINTALANQQPILIIAEDSRESHGLYTEIQKRIGQKQSFFSNKKRLPETATLQLINPNLSTTEREKCIQKAGDAGQITVSTGTSGRGTDIILQSEAAKRHGLLVINTFLPTERNQKQYAGRSARYGQKGGYVAILNKQRLKKALNKATLTDGFYTHTEDYVRQALQKMDSDSQVNRLLEHTVGDFRYQLTRRFFGMIEKVPHGHTETLLPLWSSFFAKSDQLWNAVDSDIRQALGEKQFEKAQQQLDFYSKKVLAQWEQLRVNIASHQLLTTENILVEKILEHPANPLTFNDVTTSLLQQDFQQEKLKKIRRYDYYEAGHEGRSINYTSMFTFLIASFKGWLNLLPGINFNNARRPLANVRAWSEGRGQLFVNFRASENKGLIVASALLGIGIIAAALVAVFMAPLIVGIALGAIGLFIGTSLIVSAISGLTGSVLERITEPTFVETEEKSSGNSWQNMQKDLKKDPLKTSLNTIPTKPEDNYSSLYQDKPEPSILKKQNDNNLRV